MINNLSFIELHNSLELLYLTEQFFDFQPCEPCNCHLTFNTDQLIELESQIVFKDFSEEKDLLIYELNSTKSFEKKYKYYFYKLIFFYFIDKDIYSFKRIFNIFLRKTEKYYIYKFLFFEFNFFGLSEFFYLSFKKYKSEKFVKEYFFKNFNTNFFNCNIIKEYIFKNFLSCMT
jgi:hypothetical protein